MRFEHRCPRCGWVSERPRWGALGWLTVLFLALSETESWALRVALALVAYAVLQTAFEQDKARARRVAADMDNRNVVG